MAFVTESMRASLDNLNAQIQSAEKVLRKLPGSRSENAVVYLGWYDEDDAFMRFGCSKYRDHIVVNDLDRFKTLDEYSIDIQTSLATRVPDLLTLSVASESDVRDSIDDAASAIEHALASIGNAVPCNNLPAPQVKQADPVASVVSGQANDEVSQPEPEAMEPKTEALKKEPKPENKAEDRPLTLKARTFLKLLEKHPEGLTRKSILEMTGLKSDAMSSYMGSTQGNKYLHWDKVARDTKDRSWNHVSLLGRGYVTFKAGVQTSDQGKQTVFTITESGIAAAKKLG